MSQESVEKVLGRMITDDSFRKRASLHMALACREEGYSLSDEELRMIGQVDIKSLSSVADSLDGNIKRFSAKHKAES